jgi:hypothetical protein
MLKGLLLPDILMLGKMYTLDEEISQMMADYFPGAAS